MAPPPFGRPPEPEVPTDPFAAAAGAVPAQPQIVRLEFDDKLVTDQEVGKTARMRVFIVAGVVLVVGLAIGWGVGAMLGEREIFQRTVRDAQSIYAKVDDASRTVSAAQTHVNALLTAAAGDPANGVLPAVNYDAIQALQALEKPFDANAFSGKNYNAFTAETVHDLFAYTANVDRLWAEYRVLAGETLAAPRRVELDRTAAAVAAGASTQYGAVIVRNDDDQLVGSLAFLQINQDAEGVSHVFARPGRSGEGREFQVFSGAPEQEITTAPVFVILIDGQNSRGVLAEQTGAFGRYLVRVRDLKLLIDSTVEIQGRLMQAISRALTEAGASTTASE